MKSVGLPSAASGDRTPQIFGKELLEGRKPRGS
jgi:hypothetical protein